jgi:hypothetical protein
MKSLWGTLGHAGWRLGLPAGMALAALFAAGPAHALLIAPIFDSSITGNANAAAIEGAITTAVNTIDGLYSNPVTIPVTFTYNNDGSFLATTTQSYYYPSYNTYVNLLKADSLANPENTVLATAITNLSQGNDANGAKNMAITGAQFTMLGVTAAANATITLNNIWNWSFTNAVTSSQEDAIGAFEHELDEVLGGGGAGSAINFFYGLEYGSTDLYRYSAPGTPSFTTNSNVPSYLSVDGGVTSIAAFNQGPGGDFGDFAVSCNLGNGQLIQSAASCAGPHEAYTASSPEFAMMEAIGWDPAGSDPVPEPSTLALLGASLPAFAAVRRWRRS